MALTSDFKQNIQTQANPNIQNSTPMDSATFAQHLQTTAPTTKNVGGRNILQSVAGLALDPIAKLGTEAGQFVGKGIVKGVEMFQNPEQKAQTESKLQNALNQPSRVPGLGTEVKPLNQVGARDVAGQLLETAATFAPGVGKGASLITKALSGAATGYALDVGNQLENKDKTLGQAFKPGLGTAIGGTLPLATALIGSLSKKIAGFNAGTGEEVLQRAQENPDAVGDAVKTYAKTPEAKSELIDKAKSAIQNFNSAKSEEFGATLDKFGTEPIALKEGEKSVIDSFAENAKKFGGTINGKGELTFANSTLTKGDQAAVKEGFDLINNWTDTTPKGMDGLRQAIKNTMDNFSLTGNSRANVILGNVKDDLQSMLTDKLPGYDKMLSTYGEKSQVTRDLVKELGLGGKSKPSTQLNNIMKIFKRDPSIQENLVSVMGKDGSEKFLNEISGAILSDWLPSNSLTNVIGRSTELATGIGGVIAGSGGTAIPAAAGALASMSPRIVGKIARMAGSKTAQALGGLAEKGATIAGARTGQ